MSGLRPLIEIVRAARSGIYKRVLTEIVKKRRVNGKTVGAEYIVIVYSVSAQVALV